MDYYNEFDKTALWTVLADAKDYAETLSLRGESGRR